MVVGDYDVGWFTLVPAEADPPLLVDPDAELAGEISFEGFEAITRWGSQVVQVLCFVEVDEFPSGCLLNCGWKAPGPMSVKDGFRLGA